MALTPEQIQEARKKYGVPQQGYGVAGTPSKPTTDWFADVKAKVEGSRPTRLQAITTQTSPIEKIGGEAYKTLIAKPAIRLAQATASGIGAVVGGETGKRLQEQANQPIGVPSPFGAPVLVEPQKAFGEGGARQIAGEAAKSASYLAGGGAVPGIAGATKAGQIASTALQGVKAGAISGGAYGLGEGLQDETKSAGEVAMEAGKGALVGGVAGGVLGGVAGALGKGVKATTPSEEKQIDYALNITMPKLTTKTGEEAIRTGRVTAPGIFRASKITPTAHDNVVAESVMDVVSKKNTLPQNVEAIQQKLSQTNLGVRDMIASRKIPFNKTQLRARLNASSEESNLVFASEPTAKRTYKAVVDEFMKHVDKGDTLGLFDARQTFDKVPAIKKLLDTERLGENVRRQIVLDVRRAANEYVAEQLPRNNPYRSALMRETHMLEALGNIAEQNAKEIGMNKIQILTKEYPILKWIAGGVGVGLVGGGGVGVGGTILNSSN